MKNRVDLIVVVWCLLLGVGAIMAVNGCSAFALRRSTGIPTETARPLAAFPTPSPTPTSTSKPTETPPTPTPTLALLEVGASKGKDLEDVLLLYDSRHLTSSDINLCKVAEYYGLRCKRLALDTTDLTDELLRDARGDYFKLVGIAADTLLRSPPLLTNDELAMVRSAIETGGVNLLVSKLHHYLDPAPLAELTDGAVLGVNKPRDSHRDWSVSAVAPEICRELTGQVVLGGTASPADFAITLGEQGSVTTLITSTDDRREAYPLFVRWEKGRGSVFIDAGERGSSLGELSLGAMYYDNDHFSAIMPLMFTVRYVLGDEAWHNDHDYANLTIGDAALTEPYEDLSYLGLLRSMKAHNFHTTIAFIPKNWNRSEPLVVSLFLANPDRYSLVQHGNNHDGYEFYKYSVTEEDEHEGMKLPARPLADQEADILEGLARMEEHWRHTGIPHDRIMIFPWQISPEGTLVLLKRYGFLASVNAQDVPLGATRPSRWDYGMYQANMDYGDFATLTRRHPGEYDPFRPYLDPFILDLFVDKPALFYSHPHSNQLFASGIDGFDPLADQINDLSGEVEWRGLGYIIKHLYLEKRNDDGSVDVKFYGSQVVVANESRGERIYHLYKEETLNVPISRLTVDGHEFPYLVSEGLLTLDVRVPAHSSVEIDIRYGDPAQG